MAYKFNDDDKVETEYAERLPYGVSKVQLQGATAGETDAGKEYIEITVVNEDGIEDNVRVWFVGGASPYSFNTLRQIAVHQGKDDATKEKIREAVEACDDSDALADLLNEKCAGGELWYTKYLDPKNTWTTPQGETRQSVNKSIYGYEPKLKPELMPQEDPMTKPATSAADLVGGEDITNTDAAAGIPDNWAK